MRFVPFLWIFLATFWAAFSSAQEQQRLDRLPIFLADNHGESFRWLSLRQASLEQPLSLVLIDAHSDASAAERSEQIRRELRQVTSLQQRKERVAAWRENGRIQAYNWIEPLMPRPISEVFWINPQWPDGAKQAQAQAQARRALDGRLEVEPREMGRLGRRFTTASWADWQAQGREQLRGKRVILSWDLDSLAGLERAKQRQLAEEIWTAAVSWEGLEGVCVAVSRPWLVDAAEADFLVGLVLDLARRTQGARLQVWTPLDKSRDSSAKAQELRKAGKEIPRWQWAQSPAANLALFGWGAQARAWQELADKEKEHEAGTETEAGLGQAEALRGLSLAKIRPLGVDREKLLEADLDGVWRMGLEDLRGLELLGLRGQELTGRVRWFRLKPAHAVVDLLPETRLGAAFAKQPARWAFERRELVGQTRDFMLPAQENWLPEGELGGRVRLLAEAELAGGIWWPSEILELRLVSTEVAKLGRFQQALAEQFGQTYVFGVGLVASAQGRGVESGWGADCANFLIAAWRRAGWRLDWADPAGLQAQLQVLQQRGDGAEDFGAEGFKFASAEALEEYRQQGLAVIFAQHAAAVWEDNAPLGVLGDEDILAHHLGGFPELVSLGELREKYGAFALATPALLGDESGNAEAGGGEDADGALLIEAVGDIALSENYGELEAIEPWPRVSEGQREQQEEQENEAKNLLRLGNLEGALDAGEFPGGEYDFRFAEEALEWVEGFDVLNLANNHGDDAGAKGLQATMAALQERGIGFVGAGKNQAEAYQPLMLERGGVSVAIFGVSLVESLAASEASAGVASWADHQALLLEEIAQAARAGKFVIVLTHGGLEYQARVSSGQQAAARCLLQAGARLVVGSGAHLLQREEWQRGGVVHHGLGNALWPKQLGKQDSGGWGRWRVDTRGGIRSASEH